MSCKDQTAIVKIHAMYGKMLNKKKYLEMLNCNSIEEVFSYLITNTDYKIYLKDLNQKNLDKDDVKHAIEKQSFQKCYKIYKYSNKNEILSLILEEFELKEILKIMLFKTKLNKNEKYESLIPKTFNINIKFSRLLDCDTKDELLDCLKNTHYFEIYKKVTHNHTLKINYAKYEYELYKNFFVKLLKIVKSKTKNIELFELNKIIKTIIDQINISQIYRHKFLLNLSNSQTKEKILPFHKKLTPKLLQDVLECQKKEDFEEKIRLIYSNLNDEKTNIFKIENLEIAELNQKKKICTQYLHLSLNLATVFYCFFILQKIEILNLKKIIEGTHYNIPTEEIKSLLVM